MIITTNPKILIVEDDGFMLSFLTSLFKDSGYDASAVDKYTDVLPAAQEFQPDVILLDIHLDDGYTGYNVAANLKTLDNLSSIPTVFLTAEEDDEFRCKAFMCGGLDFLRKPFDKQDILNRVKPLAMIGRMMKTLSKFNK